MLARHQNHRPPRRRGNVLAVVALLLVVLVGMVAFAVDVGFIAAKRTDLQRTADASALAGAASLAAEPGRTVDTAPARAAVREYALLNEGVAVLDDDIAFGRFDPNATGSKFSTSPSAGPVNAVQVTLRRDAKANGPLNLFFAPVIGRRSADVRAVATAVYETGVGLLPEGELLPYTVEARYFRAALGLHEPGVDTSMLGDSYTPLLGQVTGGADGVREFALFESTKKAPGNFGSVDIGSASNGTPDLVRQILRGASAADFAHPDFASKVTGGVLYAPNTFTGDTGFSGGAAKEFEQIIGQRRIIPLYSSVVLNGNNAEYTITEFAAVIIVAVDLKGQPKRVLAQPTGFFSNKVTASQPADGSTRPQINGAYTPPKLVIP